MAVISKTPTRKTVISTTQKPLSDDELRKKNQEAATTIAQYDERAKNGEYLTNEDLAIYQSATTEYIKTGDAIRKRAEKKGYTFSDDENNRWGNLTAGLGIRSNNLGNLYSTLHPFRT